MNREKTHVPKDDEDEAKGAAQDKVEDAAQGDDEVQDDEGPKDGKDGKA